MTIEFLPPPGHELREMAEGSHLYRVGFWRLNNPPSTTSWAVEWWDLHAEDVHEVIEWADGKAGTELIYTLYVRSSGRMCGNVPETPTLCQCRRLSFADTTEVSSSGMTPCLSGAG